MRLKLVFTLLLFTPIALHGQTLTPDITRCGPKCSGSYVIQNDSDRSITFTISASSLPKPHPTQGTEYWVDGAHVRLSPTKGKLAPYGVGVIHFNVRCDALPCAIQIINTFDTNLMFNGIPLRRLVAHTVFVEARTQDVVHKPEVVARIRSNQPARRGGSVSKEKG